MNIYNTYDDKLKEECGVFGMISFDHEDVSYSIYCGLCSLQHRGQESAGMALCDTQGPAGNICYHKDMGLVNDVFHPDKLNTMHGNMGVGHVRYTTTGESSARNAQPLVLNYLKGTLALVHNGNITNAEQLRESLQQFGAIFQSSTDSEVVAYQIAKNRARTSCIEDAIIEAAQTIKGGYALIVMSPRKLIAVRDPNGLKPLCLGKRGNSYILASESCALTAVDAEFVRDILPGEVLSITKNGLSSNLSLAKEKKAHCIFE